MQETGLNKLAVPAVSCGKPEAGYLPTGFGLSYDDYESRESEAVFSADGSICWSGRSGFVVLFSGGHFLISMEAVKKVNKQQSKPRITLLTLFDVVSIGVRYLQSVLEDGGYKCDLFLFRVKRVPVGTWPSERE